MCVLYTRTYALMITYIMIPTCTIRFFSKFQNFKIFDSSYTMYHHHRSRTRYTDSKKVKEKNRGVLRVSKTKSNAAEISTVRKKRRRYDHVGSAARSVIARRVLTYFQKWRRKIGIREAYRFTRQKQNRRVMRSAVGRMVSKRRREALEAIEMSISKALIRNSIFFWIQVTKLRRTQILRAEIVHKETSMRRALKKIRCFAKRRSKTRCAAAIVFQLRRRRVLCLVLKSARLHFKLRIENDVAEKARKRRAIQAMKLKRIQRRVELESKRVRFEMWKDYLEEARLLKDAHIFWARHAALNVLKNLKENIYRNRQYRDAVERHRMRSKHRALQVWRDFARENVLLKRAHSFWISSRVQDLMNRWKLKTIREQHDLMAKSEIFRFRIHTYLNIWRVRTEIRVSLRRALRIWKYGAGSCAARLVLSTMASRRMRRRDVLIRCDDLVVRCLDTSTRVAFSRWKSFVRHDRKRTRYLLSTTFWWWDQWMIERRVKRYFTRESKDTTTTSIIGKYEKEIKTPLLREVQIKGGRSRYTGIIPTLSPIEEVL